MHNTHIQYYVTLPKMQSCSPQHNDTSSERLRDSLGSVQI